MRRKIPLLGCVALLVLLSTLGGAQQNPNTWQGDSAPQAAQDLGTDPTGTTEIVTQTSDCATCYRGLGDDWAEFSLTTPTDVTIGVTDCCAPGDRFEARVNTVSPADPDLDCIVARQPTSVAPDTFDELATVTLQPGDYAIRYRDVAFQCDDRTDLCAAGFTGTLTFGPSTGQPISCLTPCADIGSGDPGCQDVAASGIPLAGRLALLVLLGALVAVGAWALIWRSHA